jgi:hypothetical protein
MVLGNEGSIPGVMQQYNKAVIGQAVWFEYTIASCSGMIDAENSKHAGLLSTKSKNRHTGVAGLLHDCTITIRLMSLWK